MDQGEAPEYQPHYHLVGAVAATWAMLDLNLDLTIVMLSGMKTEEAACITSQFSSHYPKLKAIIALCELKGVSQPTLKKLRAFSGSLSDLTERRNRAIHDAWMAKDGKLIGRFSLRKQSAAPDAAASAEELVSILNAIKKRIDTFSAIRAEAYLEIRSSREKPPE